MSNNNTKLSLTGLNNTEKKSFMNHVVNNVIRTRAKTGNGTFGESMLADAKRIEADPEGDRSKWINIFTPSMGYITNSSLMPIYEETTKSVNEPLTGCIDKNGRQLFIESKVNVYYALDGVTEQTVARETKDGMYFADNRYLLKTDIKRLVRISK